jgi:magnesium and cobalt exporter, CNNM family
MQLGRVPSVADHVEVSGWSFEVMDMDRRRVDKVLVTRISPNSDFKH